MNTPHKYADVIKAWADGKDIQYQDNGIWINWIAPFDTSPLFGKYAAWRIKPPVLRYRVALMVNTSGAFYTLTSEDGVELLGLEPDFIKWLTEWVEVEV